MESGFLSYFRNTINFPIHAFIRSFMLLFKSLAHVVLLTHTVGVTVGSERSRGSGAREVEQIAAEACSQGLRESPERLLEGWRSYFQKAGR